MNAKQLKGVFMEDAKVMKLKEIENMLNELKPTRRNTKEVQEDKLHQRPGTQLHMVEKLNRAKLPKKGDAKAAGYRRIEEVGDIDGVKIGESVVYYYGRSLAVAREVGNTPERKCKIEYIADALYRRSASNDVCRGTGDVVNSLKGGTGEFYLTQEAVRATELVSSKDGKKTTQEVTKYYYIAKRVK